MKLKDLAEIRSGLVLARKKAHSGEAVRYRVLTLRAVSPEGEVDEDALDIFPSSEELSSEYLTHVDDIVVRLTAPYTAVLIDEATEGLVVTSNFVIIRVDRRRLHPGYLFWMLNTEKTRKAIYANATSNMLAAVRARYFMELPLPRIPLAKQRTIAEMNRLAKRETALLAQLAKEKSVYNAALIDRLNREVTRK